MAKFPSQELDKFMLRLPDGMRDRIAVAAKASGRSMNAEIVQRIEQSFDDAPAIKLGVPLTEADRAKLEDVVRKKITEVVGDLLPGSARRGKK